MPTYTVRAGLCGSRLKDSTTMEDALTKAVSVMESTVFGDPAHEYAVYFVQNAAAGPARKDLAEKHWANLRKTAEEAVR